MKRVNEILLLLNKSPDEQKASAIAAACGTAVQNINHSLQTLLEDGLAVRNEINGVWMYSITEHGISKVSEPGFGGDADNTPRNTAGPRPAAKVPVIHAVGSHQTNVETLATFGIFTSGELHIEANGKRVVLTKSQARALSEFICALPNKLFAEKVTMAQLTGTHHRANDDDD